MLVSSWQSEKTISQKCLNVFIQYPNIASFCRWRLLACPSLVSSVAFSFTDTDVDTWALVVQLNWYWIYEGDNWIYIRREKGHQWYCKITYWAGQCAVLRQFFVSNCEIMTLFFSNVHTMSALLQHDFMQPDRPAEVFISQQHRWLFKKKNIFKSEYLTGGKLLQSFSYM